MNPDVLAIAVGAANYWAVGPDGPYRNPGMTGAQITRQQVYEALQHLLDLGIITIDEQRLADVLKTGVPLSRTRTAGQP